MNSIALRIDVLLETLDFFSMFLVKLVVFFRELVEILPYFTLESVDGITKPHRMLLMLRSIVACKTVEVLADLRVKCIGSLLELCIAFPTCSIDFIR
mmetsp:Transcript_23626/g.62268  ORF Transcript_23626/g.62268 Transcript_23626/m.62268 type:complete len:97 (-) Transcript_23626:1103-1393(-)